MNASRIVLPIIPFSISLLITVPVFAESYDCLIEPYQIINISSPVEGLLEHIRVDASDIVKQGDVLVELESSVERATVDAAQAKASATGELRAKETEYVYNKRQAKRLGELYEKQAVSSHEKDEADTNVQLARLGIKQTKESLKLAELELKRAQAELNQRIVHSPINGVVMDRQHAEGEFIREEPILRIAQLDPLRIEAILPASEFGSINIGEVVKVFADSPVSKTLIAKITRIDRVIDAASGTFAVRLELPNSDYKMPGGIKCKVDFTTSTASK